MQLREAIDQTANEIFGMGKKEDPLKKDHEKLGKILDKKSIKDLSVVNRRLLLDISMAIKVGKIKDAGKMITKTNHDVRMFIDDIIDNTLGSAYFKKKGALTWKA